MLAGPTRGRLDARCGRRHTEVDRRARTVTNRADGRLAASSPTAAPRLLHGLLHPAARRAGCGQRYRSMHTGCMSVPQQTSVLKLARLIGSLHGKHHSFRGERCRKLQTRCSVGAQIRVRALKHGVPYGNRHHHGLLTAPNFRSQLNFQLQLNLQLQLNFQQRLNSQSWSVIARSC